MPFIPKGSLLGQVAEVSQGGWRNWLTLVHLTNGCCNTASGDGTVEMVFISDRAKHC